MLHGKLTHMSFPIICCQEREQPYRKRVIEIAEHIIFTSRKQLYPQMTARAVKPGDLCLIFLAQSEILNRAVAPSTAFALRSWSEPTCESLRSLARHI